MAEGGLVVAPPGWFTDPVGRSDLRWWSGAEWTEYVAASPAMRPSDVPRPGSVLARTSPLIPPPRAVLPPQPEMLAYVPFGGDGSGGTMDALRSRSLVPIAPTRWNTGGAWALSATPLIGVVSGVGIGFAVTFSVWLALSIVPLPLLWSVAAATRDCRRLDAMGYGRVPSRWWLLLGPLGYLIARTVQVRQQSGHGSAPLWWHVGLVVALTTASLVARSLVAGLLPAA